MATGYEIQMYNDIHRIAKALETIAMLLRQAAEREADSACAAGCKPSEGDVCGGPRCS